MKYIKSLIVTLVVLFPTLVFAETNTVSSTVVTDKAPPTANAPSVVVNNSDVCKSAYSAGLQTGFAGVATGITVSDENCERIKLSRSLFGMGMKVAAVSTLCQDSRVFDAMMMAGTPCPFFGKIGAEAEDEWKKYEQQRPDYEEYVAALRYMEKVDNEILEDIDAKDKYILDSNGEPTNILRQ